MPNAKAAKRRMVLGPRGKSKRKRDDLVVLNNGDVMQIAENSPLEGVYRAHLVETVPFDTTYFSDNLPWSCVGVWR